MSDGEKFEIVFLLGAGASVAAGVPTTVDFVDEYRKYLENIGENDSKDNPRLNLVNKIENTLKEVHKDDEKYRMDIEDLLETLEKLKNRDKETLLYFYQCTEKDDYKLKEAMDKSEIIEDLKNFIVQKTAVRKDKIGYLYYLKNFINKRGYLRIISVNYDIAIEQFCEEYRIPYTDGFDLYWNPHNLDDTEKYQILLYKLHGSITWYQTDRKSYFKTLVEPSGNEHKLITDEKARTLILYPAQKWFFAEPILELLLKTKRILEKEDTKILIVVGYSFRDEYIKEMIWDVARKNREMIIFYITKEPYNTYEEELKYYNKNRNGKGGIESSIAGRVIWLPYRFEKILPILLSDYIEIYIEGLELERKGNQVSGAGQEYTLLGDDYNKMIRKYIKCEYVSRLMDIYERFSDSYLNDYPILRVSILFEIVLSGILNGRKWNMKTKKDVDYHTELYNRMEEIIRENIKLDYMEEKSLKRRMVYFNFKEKEKFIKLLRSLKDDIRKKEGLMFPEHEGTDINKSEVLESLLEWVDLTLQYFEGEEEIGKWNNGYEIKEYYDRRKNYFKKTYEDFIQEIQKIMESNIPVDDRLAKVSEILTEIERKYIIGHILTELKNIILTTEK